MTKIEAGLQHDFVHSLLHFHAKVEPFPAPLRASTNPASPLAETRSMSSSFYRG